MLARHGFPAGVFNHGFLGPANLPLDGDDVVKLYAVGGNDLEEERREERERRREKKGLVLAWIKSTTM